MILSQLGVDENEILELLCTSSADVPEKVRIFTPGFILIFSISERVNHRCRIGISSWQRLHLPMEQGLTLIRNSDFGVPIFRKRQVNVPFRLPAGIFYDDIMK